MIKCLKTLLPHLILSCLCCAGSKEGVGRFHEKFDGGWKFYKGELTGAEDPSFNDSDWRTLQLPHDWSIEDFTPDSLPEELAELSVVKGQWHFKKGDDGAYADADYDHGDWQVVRLPAAWEDHSNYQGIKIYGWYRREIAIPEKLRSAPFYLLLGRIGDVDETYLNGRLIGKSGSAEPIFDAVPYLSRRYKVTPNMLGDRNVVAVRVYNGWNEGGIIAENEPVRWSGPFYSLAAGGTSTAFTVGGTGWYRKAFTVPDSWEGKHVRLTFEGVYMDADVWVNGHHLGNHPYGYTEFSYDLTQYLRPIGEENLVAVEVKNRGRNTRWYSGSGIYRSIWLTAVERTHVAEYGIKITPEDISSAAATVRVETTVQNASRQELRLVHEILSAHGDVVAADAQIVESARSQARSEVHVSRPTLWDLENPYLYTLRSSIFLENRLVDRVENRFGIRSIVFDPEKGFLLNGRPTLLRGGCVHHDNGILGAVAYERAEERRVELLKANGFNAIRTAHNPPSTAFLDACDRVGMLVIDEAFDAWIIGGRPQDYSVHFNDWWERDLESLVKRDWNHPSVIMWSIGNEIHGKTKPEVVEASRLLAQKVKELDSSRPVTAGVNIWPGEDWEEVKANYMAPLDVAGYNYMWERYAEDFEQYRQRVIYGSESFPSQMFDYWMPVREYPFVIGDFVWTGFDYLGEVSIGWNGNGYPWTVAYCGDLDICGFKRAQSYYREVLWGTGKKVAIVVHHPEHSFDEAPDLPWAYEDVHRSWTWENCQGEELEVDVYSSCDEVELFLNGESLGRQSNSRDNKYIATWKVHFAPGELKAIGYSDGAAVEADALKSAGDPAALKLTADRIGVQANGADLSFLTVELVDENGIRHPFAQREIHFEISGPGEVIAVGSANPMSVESFQRMSRKSFEGRMIAIVRSTDEAGEIQVTAKTEGMEAATIRLVARMVQRVGHLNH